MDVKVSTPATESIFPSMIATAVPTSSGCSSPRERILHGHSQTQRKCLDVAGANKGNGENVHQWDCTGRQSALELEVRLCP